MDWGQTTIDERGKFAFSVVCDEFVLGQVVGCRFVGLVANPSARAPTGRGDDIAVTVRKSKNDPDDVYTAADGVGFELETLPTTGGLTKKGAGNLTVAGVNTYGGPTRIEQGTLVFATENGYPGGDLELPAETLNGKDAATPLLTAVNFALASGKKVRITQAEKLDKASFANTKVVASFTQSLAALPELEFVNSDNTVVANADYGLRLTDGGKTLKFGLTRGMVLIFR